MTGSWWPIVAMMVVYSLIGLVSAFLMPEVRDRDLSLAEDAAEKSGSAVPLGHTVNQ
jgi:MHS family metabolite:H+ symporter-like MFS transporter